jgi:hypothetical protein
MNTTTVATIVEEQEISYTVSGFFRDEDAIKNVMVECLHRGVPRDLLDVAVSPAASKHFFGGRAHIAKDLWFKWMGLGAFIGLVLSSLLTLAIIMIPGFNHSDLLAFVQLLGPDIGVIVGAALGGIYGLLKPGRIKKEMRRAALRSDAALLLIHLQPREEAEVLGDILRDYGGEEIELSADSASSVGAE